MCNTNKPYSIAKAVISVAETLSAVAAVLGVYRTYKRFKPELACVNGAYKLFVFKGLVALTTTQAFVISILQTAGVFHATAELSLVDYSTGVPNLMTSLEMFLFAPLFLWAFQVGPYKANRLTPGALMNGNEAADLSRKAQRKKVSPFTILFAAMNPSDIIRDIFSALSGGLSGRGSGGGRGGSSYKSANGGDWSDDEDRQQLQRLQQRGHQGLRPAGPGGRPGHYASASADYAVNQDGISAAAAVPPYGGGYAQPLQAHHHQERFAAHDPRFGASARGGLHSRDDTTYEGA